MTQKKGIRLPYLYSEKDLFNHEMIKRQFANILQQF